MNEASQPQIAGDEFFYEHVHFTFEGNYLLAKLLVEQIDALLPGNTAMPPGADSPPRPWPTIQECADRLAWSDFTRQASIAEILSRLSEPPFTAQLTNARQVAHLSRELQRLEAARPPDALAELIEQCQNAIRVAPEDHVLYSRLSALQTDSGDLDAAYQSALKASQLLPHDSGKLSQLGGVLALQNRNEEAAQTFAQALKLNPDDIWIRRELAKTLVRLNRNSEALEQLQSAVHKNPSYGPAYLTMGFIYQEQGRTDDADKAFRQAVEHRVRSSQDLLQIAQVCLARGWFQEALDCFNDALRLHPNDPPLLLGAAQSYDGLQQHEDAERLYLKIIERMPNAPQARYVLGVHYAKRQEHERAAEQFALAARMAPDYLDANIDFGMALLAAGKEREALAQFKQVLDRFPDNATAKEYVIELEKELGLQPRR